MTETTRNRIMVKLQWAISEFSYGMVNFRHPMRAKVLEAAADAYQKTFTNTTPVECAAIYRAVLACEKVPGDLAEAGVYVGGTARLILFGSKKRMHLFDTFEGLASTRAGSCFRMTIPSRRESCERSTSSSPIAPNLSIRSPAINA